MTYVIAWKEFREQRAMWLTIFLFNCLLLGSVLMGPAALGLSDSSGVAFIYVAVVLTGIYGLISGSMLIAGEREAQTLAFLDTASALRTPIWNRKLLAGGLFSIIQCCALILALIGFSAISPEFQHVARDAVEVAGFSGLLGIVCAGTIVAYVMGFLFSAFCKTVTTAAIFGATATLITIPSIMAFVAGQLYVTAVIFGLILIGSALSVSWWAFCRTDLERDWGLFRSRAASKSGKARAITPGSSIKLIRELRSITSLCWSQGRIAICVLIPAGAVLGLTWLRPTNFLWLWPMATLFTGLICGTAVFAGEQIWGTARHLGEMRVPPGRFWFTKIGFWAIIGTIICGLAFLMMLAVLIIGDLNKFYDQFVYPVIRRDAGPTTNFLTHMFSKGTILNFPTGTWWPAETMGLWSFIGLCFAFGFSVAQFCCLLFRKPIISAIVAVMITPMLLALWLPSLVAGGLPMWQIWLIPVALLTTTRLIMWPWMTGTMTSPKVITGLTAVALGCFAWTGAALAYRFMSIPDVGEPFDTAAFLAAKPKDKENEAGILAPRALKMFRDRYAEAENKILRLGSKLGANSRERAEFLGKIVRPRFVPAKTVGELAMFLSIPGSLSATLTVPPLLSRASLEILEDSQYSRVWESDPIDAVLADGRWQSDFSTAARMLNYLFEGEWYDELKKLRDLPRGAVLGHVPGVSDSTFQARLLQLQAHGRHDEILELISTRLALGRTLSNYSSFYIHNTTTSVIWMVMKWLEQPGPTESHLAKLTSELRIHTDMIQEHHTQSVRTGYLGMQEFLDMPDRWLPDRYYYSSTKPDKTGLEKKLVAAALLMPWERERQRRIINLLYAGYMASVNLEPRKLMELVKERENRERVRSEPDIGKATLSEHLWIGTDLPIKEDPMAFLLRTTWAIHLYDGGRNSKPWHDFIITRLRGVELMSGLVHHHLKTGRPAKSLDELVPNYMPDHVVDPYSEERFQYRVSSGEKIWGDRFSKRGGGPDFVHDIHPGQGVSWSIGYDLENDEGKKLQSVYWGPSMQGDIVFWTPKWLVEQK